LRFARAEADRESGTCQQRVQRSRPASSPLRRRQRRTLLAPVRLARRCCQAADTSGRVCCCCCCCCCASPCPVSVSRTIPPPSSAAGTGRPAAAAAAAAAGLQQLRPLPERHMGIGHWAYWPWALGIWALGLGPWHSDIGHWLGTLREIGRVVSRTGACAARRIAAPLSRCAVHPRPRACEGSCYSPLTHRRHSSAAHAPSCLPQRLCASACRPRARRCPRLPDGHPVANKPAKRWGPGAANGCTASCARRLRRRSHDAMKARRTVRPQRARVQALVQAWRERPRRLLPPARGGRRLCRAAVGDCPKKIPPRR